MSQRFLEISPWVREPDEPAPPLTDDLDADAVVIGGGYAGLTTALALREQGASVALLERDFAGSGASGRNAGHLTPTIGKDAPTLLRLFGRERAGALFRFAEAAVAHTEESIRKRGIDCDYVASGNILGGVHGKHERPLRRAAEVAASVGARVRYLDADALRERGVPPAFRCGMLEEEGGHLHPGRYVMGLRRRALEAGVRLFENSALVSLHSGRRVVARTATGAVSADHAVLATNAYTASTGWKRRTVAPLRVQLFETERLSAEDLASLGWPGREGVYTAHEVLESYRLTAQDTLVGGSRVVRVGYGDALPRAHDPAAFAVIEGAFRQRFPTLESVPVQHFWGGWVGLTTDFLPALGVDGPGANVHYGVGFAGHGVAQATLMGEMLAASVQGREHEFAAALRRRQFGWPPEPLRWLAGKLIIGVLEALDRRTDRRIRAGR